MSDNTVTNDAGEIASVSIDTPTEEVTSVEFTPEIESEDVSTIEQADDTEEVSDAAEDDKEADAELDAEIEKSLADEEAKAKESNTPLANHLRKVIRSKEYEIKALRNAPTTETIEQPSNEATEIYNGLMAFDTEKGVPSAKPFADKIFAKSPEIAEQALWDLANQATGKDGMTLGHKFLEKVGLDPHRLDDLRAFSKGEVSGEQFGIIDIPSNIPPEYTAVFKVLPKTTREDVEYGLFSEDPEQVQAALDILDNKKFRIEGEQKDARERIQQETDFRNEVAQKVDTQIVADFTTILDSIATNPAYTSVKISSNPQIDSFAKGALISDITALGDPNSVLSNRAFAKFEAMGVKVDRQKVQGLLSEIENHAKTAVIAETQAKRTGGNYTTQITEALNRKAEAIQKAVAYSNKIFSQTLSKMTAPNEPKQVDAVPSTNGRTAPASPAPQSDKVMTEKELDAFIMNKAKTVAKMNN